MYPFDIFQARAAECQQRAKNAQTEDEKHSWLALADSWLVTAQLRQTEATAWEPIKRGPSAPAVDSGFNSHALFQISAPALERSPSSA